MTGREQFEAMRAGAAQMLAQALGMDGDAAELAGDLHVVARHGDDATFAVELAAGDDSAAFLVYGFGLAALDADGRSGAERLETALATMDTAAKLGAPGPRAVAHATDDQFGYVLATSPEQLRRLAGDAAPDPTARPMTTEERRRERERAIARLARHLRGAEEAAALWLAAASDDPDGRLVEETELALHLLEPGHLDTLMRAVNRLIAVPGAERR